MAEMAKATAKVSQKIQREDDQYSVKKMRPYCHTGSPKENYMSMLMHAGEPSYE